MSGAAQAPDPRAPGRVRVTAHVLRADYEILIAPAIAARLGALLRERARAARYALITDATVGALHGADVAASVRTAGAQLDVFEFPAGEVHKTRATWTELSDRLLACGIGRDAAVIALGGGVVGDVAGFVAATYMRGIPCIQVPTTLLAMIDASIGGKTGVDVTAGKNLIGAFHPPALVVVDPLLLDTLPDAELRNGLAEAVKHGAIADARHFRWLVEQTPVLTRRDPAALAALIRHSVEIKAAVVGRDPDERGERAILNFGHTAAHALERLTGYALPHGHAVSIGMVIAARLGETLGVTEPGTTDALREALDGFALPTRPPDDVAPADLAAAAASDKKARAGTIRFSLLRRIGVAAQTPDGGWTFPIEASALAAVLAEPRSTARA